MHEAQTPEFLWINYQCRPKEDGQAGRQLKDVASLGARISRIVFAEVGRKCFWKTRVFRKVSFTPVRGSPKLSGFIFVPAYECEF